eukprot:GHVU01090640.1.p2 GENE.GHVU01090640.1~~GHVU01090640.1.p2  ORF type:complete len:205 (+),score=23.66 GHVU01090640.1:1189-1803(+)
MTNRSYNAVMEKGAGRTILLGVDPNVDCVIKMAAACAYIMPNDIVILLVVLPLVRSNSSRAVRGMVLRDALEAANADAIMRWRTIAFLASSYIFNDCASYPLVIPVEPNVSKSSAVLEVSHSLKPDVTIIGCQEGFSGILSFLSLFKVNQDKMVKQLGSSTVSFLGDADLKQKRRQLDQTDSAPDVKMIKDLEAYISRIIGGCC